MLVNSFILLLLVVGLEFSRAPSYSLRRPGFECPTPNLANGRVRIRFRSRVAKFQCEPGYEIVGNKYATCSHGKWDEPTPVCVRPSGSCRIPELQNGMVLQQHQDAWLTFFCEPGYTLHGPNSIYCDGSGWNDTIPTCLSATPGSSEPALSCDFESPDLCGWRHDDFHDFDWRRFNKKTPSSFMNTGPKFDHTHGPGMDGYYMYIESTAKITNSTARLLSPLYDSSIAKNGCFQFYYHMYGLSTGGLRVYEKPASKHQEYILGKNSYMIFDLWYNQGDFWHRAVVPLKDYKEDFQLIIEGIRGISFTSDIAIDDVSILQGDNCTKALQAVAEPTSTVPPIDSCVGRCDRSPADARFLGTTFDNNSCGCGISCLIQMTCCPDYLDVCEFTKDSSDNSPYDDDDLNDSQKEKLVASTSDEPTSTTVKATTAQTTTTTTTPAPTTVKTTTKIVTTTAKTEKPTTVKTETTTKSSTKITLTFLTTEKIHNANIPLNITTTVKTVATTSKPATVPQKNWGTTTPKRETTTAKPATVSTTLLDDIIVDRTVAAIDKSSLQKEKIISEEPKSKSKALVTVLVILATLVTLAAAAWTVVIMRSSQGRSVINRLRGRVYNDPEVRFLTRDVDN